MAKPYVSGPVDIFCGLWEGGRFVPKFLGHGKVAPQSELRPSFKPVHADISGTGVPFDFFWSGEEGFTVVDLTRWNESVLRLIQTRPFHRLSEGGRGSYSSRAPGAFMMIEKNAYPLWLRYTYEKKDIFRDDMPKGLHFFASWLEGPDVRRPGTKVNEIHLMWHHIAAYTDHAATGPFQPIKATRFALYDEDMTAIEHLPIN